MPVVRWTSRAPTDAHQNRVDWEAHSLGRWHRVEAFWVKTLSIDQQAAYPSMQHNTHVRLWCSPLLTLVQSSSDNDTKRASAIWAAQKSPLARHLVFTYWLWMYTYLHKSWCALCSASTVIKAAWQAGHSILVSRSLLLGPRIMPRSEL